MADRTMICAYCGTTRPWPADFPLAVEAKCRTCCEASRIAGTSVLVRGALFAVVAFAALMLAALAWGAPRG